MKWLKKFWWVVLLGALAVAVIGFVAWGSIVPAPMPEAIAALQSDEQVQVTTEPWLVFEPTQQIPTTGFIIYPGGRVDPRSYAPQANTIAEQGYLVVIVPMPLNLAVFGSGKAGAVIEAYLEIDSWVIGGHSLGGSMAASYAYNHPDQIDGLVLWASYPASSNDLTNSGIKVASISASLDGLATPDKIEASRSLLPADTNWLEIDGGNHAQFGWYGDQAGDNPATITREAQQAQVIQATFDLIKSVSTATQ
ncbi:MAG: alpha/beta hydrolase [Anaerolineales bacterium]|nr:alpha/beta hydrolase [Anaerolineae bacterium]PWB54121.1 MAG: alpha/beta hydrolase [Anaerolineales bacterium]